MVDKSVSKLLSFIRFREASKNSNTVLARPRAQVYIMYKQRIFLLFALFSVAFGGLTNIQDPVVVRRVFRSSNGCTDTLVGSFVFIGNEVQCLRPQRFTHRD